jgi:hypothetical protein
MTDRVKGFTVSLEKDIRIDDVEIIMQAISMIKGVADVTPSVSNPDDHINRIMLKHKFLEKFYDFIEKELK